MSLDRSATSIGPRLCLGQSMVWALSLLIVMPFLGAKDKLTPEELVSRHLESIGTADARAAVENLAVSGQLAVVSRRGGAGRMDGNVRLISSSENQSVLQMVLNQAQYRGEEIAFDGKDVSVAQIRPGTWSLLGDFLRTQHRPVAEGLVGGVLSLRWPLSKLESMKPRLKYQGLKKVDGVQLHAMDYRPRESTDLSIRLFFDPETFRHVRTEYKMRIAAAMGARPEASSQQQDRRFLLVESFGDFADEQGLMLPHSYQIEFTVETQTTIMTDWTMKLGQFQTNQTIDPAVFSGPR